MCSCLFSIFQNILSCYLILFWFLWTGSLRIAITVHPCLSCSNPWCLMLSESDWLVIWEPVIGRSAKSLLICSDNLKFYSFHLWTFYWSVDFLLWIILPLFIFCYTFEWFTWRSIGKILCRTVYGYNSLNYILFCCLQWEENFIKRKFLLIYIYA